MSGKVRSIQTARDQKAAKESETTLELTYGQLMNAHRNGALAALLNQRFPGRLMQLVKLGEALNAELKSFETAQAGLIEKHGGKSADDGTVDFGSKAKQAAADADFQELVDTKLAIKGPRLTDDELEKSSLTPAQVMNLTWLTVNHNG